MSSLETFLSDSERMYTFFHPNNDDLNKFWEKDFVQILLRTQLKEEKKRGKSTKPKTIERRKDSRQSCEFGSRK